MNREILHLQVTDRGTCLESHMAKSKFALWQQVCRGGHLLAIGIAIWLCSVPLQAQDPVYQFSAQEMMSNHNGAQAGNSAMETFRRVRANIIRDASGRGGVYQISYHRFTADYLDNNTLRYALYHSSGTDGSGRLVPINTLANKIGATEEVSGLSGGVVGIAEPNHTVEHNMVATDLIVNFNNHQDYWFVVDKVETDRGVIVNYGNSIGNGSAWADTPLDPWTGFGAFYADIRAFEISPSITAGSVSSVTSIGANLNATSHKNATGYYVVVPQGSAAPTPQQIVAGTNYGGVTVAASGSLAMQANVSATASISGLAQGTAYQAYAVGVSDVGALLGRRTMPLAFTTTINTPPSIGSIAAQAVCRGSAHTGVNFSVSDSENAASTLTLSGSSSNTALVPNGNITFTGSGATRNVVVTPVAVATGTAVITVTVTDPDGLTASRTFNFTVRPLPVAQTTSTLASCVDVADGGVSASATGGTAPYTFMWSTGATGPNLTNVIPGNYLVLAIDAFGCSGGVNTLLQFDDNEPPTIVLRVANAYFDENGIATVTPEMIDDGSFDNCGIDTKVLLFTEIECAETEMGSVTIPYTVTDVNGNVSQANATVNVTDTIRPTAVAQDITVQLNANGLAVVDAMDADGGSFDNCQISGRSLSITTFDCGDIGPQQVTLTVTDSEGNTAQASFTVTVVDALAPIVQYVSNPTVYLDATGNASLNAGGVISFVSDNCGLASTGFNISGFNCANLGSNTVTYTAEDFAGNVTNATAQVMVVDTVKPTLAISSIVLDVNAQGTASLTESVLMPFAADACGIAEVAIQKTSWTCAESGNTTQVIVFDMNGNFIQRTFQVFINDEIAPTITVQDITVVLGADGVVDLNLDMIEFAASDNCGVALVALSHESVSCDDLAPVVVTITVWDNAGNTASQTFTVTVIDNIAPVFECPAFTTLCAGPFDTANLVTVQDNCSVALTQTSGPASGTVLTPGLHVVEFLAVDLSGNSATCSTTIEVVELPEVDLGPNLEVPVGESVTLTAGNAPDQTYLWSNGETTPEITFTVVEDAVISVSVTNADGCVTVDEVQVTAMSGLSAAHSDHKMAFELYPNPTTDIIHMRFAVNEPLGKTMLTIVDVTGKVLQNKQINGIQNGNVISVDVSQLPQGLYFATITTEDFRSGVRFSKK